MDYIKVSKIAANWGISSRRVRILCAEGKIPGVIRRGKLYMIPENAVKPADGRVKRPAVFSAIEAKKERLCEMPPLTECEAERLDMEFMIEFTYNSNAIEGNTLTLEETALALEGMTVDRKPLKDHLEAVGHRDAFLYAKEVAVQQLPLSEDIIKNIHALVLMNRPDDKGVYRRIPVRIMGAFTDTAQPNMISSKMAQLLSANEERKGSMTDIERAALFHLEFEAIHPFIDGNGRTGRLLLNLDLIRNGYPPINIKFADRKRYYDAFDSFCKDNDPKPMTTLIAECLDVRLDEYFAVMDKDN